MTSPDISVIVPVYNVADYLCTCVDSILTQKDVDIECILVDDGSTDNSWKICDLFAAQDHRVSVIHKQNGGLSDARNAGLDAARGKFVSFVDSDDMLYGGALRVLRHLVAKDNLDISVGNVVLRDVRTNEVRPFGALKAFCDEDDVYTLNCKGRLLDAMFNVSVCNKMFRRSLFDSRSFIAGIKFEDVPVWTDILFSGARIGCVNEPVYQYNVNREGSIVTARDYRDYPDVWTYQRKALESHGLFHGKLANDFTARIVMKFIQAYNFSSAASRREFYQKTQFFFRGCGNVGLDTAHGWPVSCAEHLHLVACRNLPYEIYNILFGPERVIAHPAINAWLRKWFQ